MNEVINFIFTLIPWLIMLAIVGGVVCFANALRGIYQENTILEDRFSSYTNQGHLKKEDLENIDKKNSDEEGVTHLKLRLLALLKATNFDAKTREISTPILPKLEDLHELTLRNEQSRTSTSMMTTIVSILLILGILGTLTGVHSTMREEVFNQQVLGKALQPSILAVIGTILLMILKGIYLRRVDCYVARLDALTISYILPALQGMRAQKNKQMKVFADKVEEQTPQIQHMHELIKKEEATDILEKKINLISETIKDAKITLTERTKAMTTLQQKLTSTKHEIAK